MKIHRFEKPVARPRGGDRRGPETLEMERPTLPELSLESRGGGAAMSPDDVAEQMDTARDLFARGKLSQARAILDMLVSRGVGGAPARTLLGIIHVAQGSTERALACFEAALEEDPSEVTARLYRGEVLLGRGEPQLAQEDLLHVLEVATAGSPLVTQARRLLQRIDDLLPRKKR